jgi:hypothetical protein
MEQGDIVLSLENSYLLNLLLNALRGSLSDQMIRDVICGFLFEAAVDLREKYSL